MTGRLHFPSDAIYVADLDKAIKALAPDSSRFFDEGLCHSVEKFTAAAPEKTFEMKARKMIETYGDLIKFRWSWEQFKLLMLKPSDGKPGAKTFSADVEY